MSDPIKGNFLNKAAILSQDDLVREKLVIPEWGGGHVFVTSMTSADRDEFEVGVVRNRDENATAVNLDNFRSKLCVFTIVNEAGKRMFTIKEIDLLGAKNAAALNRIYGVACRLNGIGKKDVEDLTKN